MYCRQRLFLASDKMQMWNFFFKSLQTCSHPHSTTCSPPLNEILYKLTSEKLTKCIPMDDSDSPVRIRAVRELSRSMGSFSWSKSVLSSQSTGGGQAGRSTSSIIQKGSVISPLALITLCCIYLFTCLSP